AARVMGHDRPPYGDRTPLFLLERTLIRDGLSHMRPRPVMLARYLARLAQSNLPTWQRIAQGAWMTALLVPSTDARARIVHLRRSGSARPAWLRRLVRLVRS
ncbi:MAG: hypothetical protein Q4G43_05295, partial [Mobilicoccus sp.]|nr:hypothetical protein [Mobilicoccus sp.]